MPLKGLEQKTPSIRLSGSRVSASSEQRLDHCTTTVPSGHFQLGRAGDFRHRAPNAVLADTLHGPMRHSCSARNHPSFPHPLAVGCATHVLMWSRRFQRGGGGALVRRRAGVGSGCKVDSWQDAEAAFVAARASQRLSAVHAKSRQAGMPLACADHEKRCAPAAATFGTGEDRLSRWRRSVVHFARTVVLRVCDSNSSCSQWLRPPCCGPCHQHGRSGGPRRRRRRQGWRRLWCRLVQRVDACLSTHR